MLSASAEMAPPEMGDGEMPSEKIYSSVGDIDVRVAWGTTGTTVQVATLVRDAPGFKATQRVISIVNEWLVEAGEPPIELEKLVEKMRHSREKRGELSLDPYFDGFHATIDNWQDLNELIRVLRRARDTVHGKPE